MAVTRRLASAAAMACAVQLAVLMAQQELVSTAYRQLSRDSRPGRPAGGDEKRADREDRAWEAVRERNADIAAWLTVEGTPIDYPVVQAESRERSTWYLSHNVFGDPDPYGTPYLDWRCRTDERHAIVYGHHALDSRDKMFSPLHRAHLPDEFAALQGATWEVPELGSIRHLPVCALKVDQSYTAIQRFSFSGEEGFRTWLTRIAEGSSARSSDLRDIVRSATRCLTLVTCSSSMSGQRDRTLVLFAAP